MKVLNSLTVREEYILISLFLINSSNFAIIKGRVFIVVEKPAIADVVCSAMCCSIYSWVDLVFQVL